MKPPLRTKSVGTKVSEEEFAALESRARARKLTLSVWVRAELLEPRADGGGAAGEVLLGEVLALRTILLNLMFSLTNGKPVTPEAMRELIEKADGDKALKAMERLTAAVPKVEAGAERKWRKRAEMAEWGRKEYRKPWPSRRPVWTLGAIFAATVVFAGLLTVQYERSWTAAQGLYWKDYLKSGARAQASARATDRYTLLEGMTAKGQGLILKGRPDRGGDGPRRKAGLAADRGGGEARHRPVAVGDGHVQRPGCRTQAVVALSNVV